MLWVSVHLCCGHWLGPSTPVRYKTHSYGRCKADPVNKIWNSKHRHTETHTLSFSLTYPHRITLYLCEEQVKIDSKKGMLCFIRGFMLIFHVDRCFPRFLRLYLFYQNLPYVNGKSSFIIAWILDSVMWNCKHTQEYVHWKSCKSILTRINSGAVGFECVFLSSYFSLLFDSYTKHV